VLEPTRCAAALGGGGGGGGGSFDSNPTICFFNLVTHVKKSILSCFWRAVAADISDSTVCGPMVDVSEPVTALIASDRVFILLGGTVFPSTTTYLPV